MAAPTPPQAQGGNPFTRKLGPLPGWAWVVVGVGGVMLYSHLKGGSSTSSGSSGSSTGTLGQSMSSADLYSLLSAQQSGYYGAYAPGQAGGTGVTNSSPPNVNVTVNNGSGVKASGSPVVRQPVKTTHRTVTASKSPGKGTTSGQHHALNTGTHAQAAFGHYTVRAGNNLSQIGAMYGESWQTLYRANRSAVGANPNLIHPGLVLKVPATRKA